MIDKLPKCECTGCKVCGDVCPTNAIHFNTEPNGFWYPIINYDKCIHCDKCSRTCPSMTMEVNKQGSNPLVYSAWLKDDKMRLESTSGGMFYAFAEYILSQGGSIAGSVYNDDWKSAHHELVNDEAGVKRVLGSKYFQSNTEGIYKAVKERLKDGKPLLFCGTPCQIAGLHSYLGKSYENLYLMDFICRSINSPLAFRCYIEELEKKHDSKVNYVHLKNKKYGWHSLATQVRFENGDEEINDKSHDWWVKGFIYNDLYTRESCFQCKYKTLPRKNADITIGDFWGIQYQSKEDNQKGISAVLINTKRGMELFEHIQDKLVYSQSTLDMVLPGNPALIKNPVRNIEKENAFFNNLQILGFSESVKRSIYSKANDKLTTRIKKKIKEHLVKYKKVYHVYKNPTQSLTKYIYYNYFCKNVIRKSDAKIIPSKHAVLDLSRDARIYLDGNQDLQLGFNQLRGSKSETHIRMNGNAIWKCKGGWLFYNTVLEVKDHAVLDTGFFSMNSGSVVIADQNITMGNDVMIGRNVIIYDSDFHQLIGQNGESSNIPQPVTIGNHVWLTSNIMVQKGVKIGDGNLVAANTVVNKSIDAQHSIIAANATGKVISDHVGWNRNACKKEASCFKR